MDECLEGHIFESATVTELMDKVLKQEGLDLEPDSHEYRQVAEVALRAAIEINRMQQSRLFGSFNPKPTDEILATSPKKPAKTDGEAITFDDLISKFVRQFSIRRAPSKVPFNCDASDNVGMISKFQQYTIKQS